MLEQLLLEKCLYTVSSFTGWRQKAEWRSQVSGGRFETFVVKINMEKERYRQSYRICQFRASLVAQLVKNLPEVL